MPAIREFHRLTKTCRPIAQTRSPVADLEHAAEFTAQRDRPRPLHGDGAGRWPKGSRQDRRPRRRARTLSAPPGSERFGAQPVEHGVEDPSRELRSDAGQLGSLIEDEGNPERFVAGATRTTARRRATRPGRSYRAHDQNFVPESHEPSHPCNPAAVPHDLR